MTIAQRILEIREQRGLDRGAFGAAVGVSTNTIGFWERGERSPAFDALVAICNVFSVDGSWLLLGHGSGPAAREEPLWRSTATVEVFGTPKGSKRFELVFREPDREHSLGERGQDALSRMLELGKEVREASAMIELRKSSMGDEELQSMLEEVNDMHQTLTTVRDEFMGVLKESVGESPPWINEPLGWDDAVPVPKATPQIIPMVNDLLGLGAHPADVQAAVVRMDSTGTGVEQLLSLLAEVKAAQERRDKRAGDEAHERDLEAIPDDEERDRHEEEADYEEHLEDKARREEAMQHPTVKKALKVFNRKKPKHHPPPSELFDPPDEDRADDVSVEVGMRVRHRKFGIGKIEGVEMGSTPKVKVRFAEHGTKMIALRYLEPLENMPDDKEFDGNKTSKKRKVTLVRSWGPPIEVEYDNGPPED